MNLINESEWREALEYYLRELPDSFDWRPVMTYNGVELAEPGKYWLNRNGALVNTYCPRDENNAFPQVHQTLRQSREYGKFNSYYYVRDGGKKKVFEQKKLMSEVFGEIPYWAR